ncbi:hypothetical protein, conserved [Eimeria necatrix]|uniref:Uncharacterized protein n=1 Tax=Eimeria necatrix TaxID=51315 RepID=U6MHL8_9EIME|nr:hypothetical protein, conserved [Eimeria necatrix]CDJ62538.1 hypothetical protein, conserved [Eimeria necatrix]
MELIFRLLFADENELPLEGYTGPQDMYLENETHILDSCTYLARETPFFTSWSCSGLITKKGDDPDRWLWVVYYTVPKNPPPGLPIPKNELPPSRVVHLEIPKDIEGSKSVIRKALEVLARRHAATLSRD